MANQTTRGYFTTPAGDAVNDMESWLLDLAQQVEDRMPKIARGVVTVNVNSASSASAPAVFPAGLYDSAPVVTCTSRNSSFFATHGTPTPDGVTISVRHVDNTATTNSILVDWVADGS